ncbi:MAG: hypothetical protein DMG30_22925 [Acidobacteria bacterium]|nr:MAG: hypothetical protein DMG30_22925 [Acidobacteriota bacterium]
MDKGGHYYRGVTLLQPPGLEGHSDDPFVFLYPAKSRQSVKFQRQIRPFSFDIRNLGLIQIELRYMVKMMFIGLDAAEARQFHSICSNSVRLDGG